MKLIIKYGSLNGKGTGNKIKRTRMTWLQRPNFNVILKGIVHTKIIILSLLIHPHLINK